MKDLDISVDNDQPTMSSYDLRAVINAEREAAGENPIRNDQFVARIEDELEGELPTAKFLQWENGGRKRKAYDLTKDQSLLVGMRESKAVRRSVLNRLNEAYAAGVEAERRMQITDDDLKPKYSALAMWRGFMSPTSTRSLKKSILTTLYNLAYAHPVSAEIVKTSDDKRDFLLSPHLALVALQSMFKEEEKRFDDADLKDIDARGKFELLKEHRDEVRAEISGDHPSMSRLTTDNTLLKSETHLLA